MTIKKHILSYLSKVDEFKTSDIQDLSFEGVLDYGRRLGSTGTYERTFRKLRQDKIIVVEQTKGKPKQKQYSWKLKEIKWKNTYYK